ncbi:uracil-DNA glycosylase family protein [Micromonospora ureilytica]|uniref:uracil-DNA glycosylase family protein n=1 Tax=Micromonospora ureilytica TaxID=709868 RepID=UPI0040394FC8
MAEQTGSAPGAQRFIPPDADTIDDLRTAAGGCRGCELYRDASQTVFGRGDESARVVLVGEQPGDMEDQKGLPFVGPAGRLLRRAVDDAGLEPGHLYLTNAVALVRVCIKPSTAPPMRWSIRGAFFKALSRFGNLRPATSQFSAHLSAVNLRQRHVARSMAQRRSTDFPPLLVHRVFCGFG